jgi:iron complex outermembrane receptor protein
MRKMGGFVRGQVRLGAAVAFQLIAARATTSFAQTAPADTAGGPLQEVVVTAQKRPENVNSVPIVVSVMTNQDLVQTGVDTTQELEWTTPGLVFGNTNGFAEPYIRGIGTDLISPGQDSPIGFYLDGVYLPFTASLLQEFGDIERVEVLKGPQGTLYGRNTTGGAVNVITRDPDQTFTADGSVSAGNLGYAKATTYVNGGLTNDLSADFAAVYAYHNGFFDVVNTGAKMDNLNEIGLRSKLKYVINDTWDVLFGGDYSYRHDSSNSAFSALAGNDLGLPPGVGPALTARDTYSDLDPLPHQTVTDFGLNLTVRGHLSWATFTSISGFRDDYLTSLADGDLTSLPLIAYASGEGEQQFTQEFQLASVGDSPLQWLGGLYYLVANAFEAPVDVWADSSDNAPPAAVLYGRTHIISYAGYGQASYALPDGFKLTAGVRTTYEQRQLTQQGENSSDWLDPAVRTAEDLPPLTPSRSWTSTDPKGTIQWEHPGQMLYASYSTGFQAGSYNLLSNNGAGPLDPENIKAYEVGGKHDLPFLPILDQSHIDWAVFYYNYKNIQVAVQDPGTGGINDSQNAATSINKGVDLDLAVPIVRNLTATLGMEYLDARYESYPDASVPNIVDGNVVSAMSTKSVDASGNRMERAPVLTSTLRVQYLVPLPIGSVSTTALYYHNSGFYFDAGNEFQQKAYNLANFRIEYAAPGSRWSVAAWIDNAFNATVIAGVASSPYVESADYTDPRLYGLSAAVHF